MSRHVLGILFARGLLAVIVLSAMPSIARAQTTVRLAAPGTEAFDTMVRSGSHASTNFDGDELMTRASDTTDYVRRTLVKFDTETRVPSKAAITSATLTLTVKEGNEATRTLSAYRVSKPFDAANATWKERKQDLSWNKGGGDLGKKYAEATVTATAGSKVTFDVTKLVQEAVNGKFDTRWTRIAVIDEGSPAYDSYKVYYSSEASDASVRPTLTVVYGGGSGLPSDWAAADIGRVAKEGSAKYKDGEFSVRAAGADIWHSRDQMHFVFRTLEGDGTIEARVKKLDNVNEWTKAGVMVREELSADSRHAFMLVSPGNGLAFQRRQSTDRESEHTAGGNGSAPYFVRLTRAGSTFSGYTSKDGSSWSLVGRSTISMASTVYAGLAVTSHDADAFADATFTDVSVDEGTPADEDDDGDDDEDDDGDDDDDDDETPPPPPPPSGTTLRLLHWNTHHGGVGADGRYDPDRLAKWIATFKPDVASLNEVDSQSQVDAIVNALESRTGETWNVSFSGRGNLVISRLPLSSKSRCAYPDGERYAAHLSTVVNGRSINVWSTHLTVDSASARKAEVESLQACAVDWSEARILAGDYNMQAGSSEYNQALDGYTDAWKAAKALGTARNYSGNCDGCTRNTRIDYTFTSKGATWLELRSAEVFDTRDSNGKMASDHKPMLVVYDVR